jgi:NADPH:quinone reductase-like Zn-dependent oxidoreductase
VPCKRTFGEPGIVLELADLPEPPALAASEVLIGVEHAPILSLGSEGRTGYTLDEMQVVHVE